MDVLTATYDILRIVFCVFVVKNSNEKDKRETHLLVIQHPSLHNYFIFTINNMLIHAILSDLF